MTQDNKVDRQETLGAFLVRQRLEKNLEFDDIQKETKIPPKSLKAIETDDYNQLPADAFARGFYRLYAKSLDLDSGEVLSRFDRERTNSPQKGKYSLPSKQEKQVNTMAARPSMTTGATLGFSLVVIIAVASFFSWYFSWNPATYISNKLRSFQEPAEVETQLDSKVGMDGAANPAANEVLDSKYFLTVDFLQDTTVTVTVDDSLPEKEVYSKGSTRSWYASQSITLIFPESASVELFFNGSRVDLPASQDGLISLHLP